MKIKKNNPIAIFLVVGGLLIFLHWTGILRSAENFLIFLTQPLSGRLYNWGMSFSRSYRANQLQEDWPARAAALAKEVADLTVANSRYLEMAEENRKLRATLNFLSTSDFQAVTAGVIAKEAAAEDSRDIIINRGSRDGLRSGLGVVSEEGVIIGQVVEVKEMIAKVCLTTSPGCQLPAAIQNQDKTQGITSGDLGLTIKMSYIPRLEKISPGDTVITSGLGGNIPRGLVIGKVIRVINESNEVWQEATIEPLINLDDLTVVSVIVP
ncbi:MAG: rod shape-determining protein MreC [Patescibacteria group bacterium]